MNKVFVDENIKEAEFIVEQGDVFQLRLAYFDDFPATKMTVHVKNGGTFEGAFVDFSSKSGKFELDVHLEGENSSASWNYAGISKERNDKTISASIYHDSPNTKASVVQYGIALEKGRLSFLGESTIKKGSYASETHQKEKIIVFDEDCVGKCSPVLNIDENDVVASHSAIVGKLSEEHLFYLLARGIPLDEAKRLLVLGYLRPALAFFEGELSSRINETIERGFGQ